MIELPPLSDAAWDRAIAVAGGDARILLRGLLALSPCVVKAVVEGSGADWAMLSKAHPVSDLADAGMAAVLARYGSGRPVAELVDDFTAEIADRMFRRHRADTRRLGGPGSLANLLRLARGPQVTWPRPRIL